MGRVKGMGGRVAGCMRWAREGNTDSLNKTWVAPESARMGEGVIVHRRAGGEGPSLSESYGDVGRSEARVRWAKGKSGVGKGGDVVEEGERIKKHRWWWRVGAVFCPRGGSMGRIKPGGSVGHTG